MNFINFRWSKTLLPELSPVSIPASLLLSSLHWPPINTQISSEVATQTYKVLSTQQPTYLSLQFNFLPPSPVQSSASFYWPVSTECSQNENQIRPLCLLFCSSTNLEPNTSCHQNFTITQITLKRDSKAPGDCPHLRFKLILNAGALTNLLHYITDFSSSEVLTDEQKIIQLSATNSV